VCDWLMVWQWMWLVDCVLVCVWLADGVTVDVIGWLCDGVCVCVYVIGWWCDSGCDWLTVWWCVWLAECVMVCVIGWWCDSGCDWLTVCWCVCDWLMVWQVLQVVVQRHRLAPATVISFLLGLYFICTLDECYHHVPLHCWFADRKSIWPAKYSAQPRVSQFLRGSVANC